MYTYSNSNYFALGAIIEAVTGQSYASNLDQYIIQPPGLQNTYDRRPAALAAARYENYTLVPNQARRFPTAVPDPLHERTVVALFHARWPGCHFRGVAETSHCLDFCVAAAVVASGFLPWSNRIGKAIH